MHLVIPKCIAIWYCLVFSPIFTSEMALCIFLIPINQQSVVFGNQILTLLHNVMRSCELLWLFCLNNEYVFKTYTIQVVFQACVCILQTGLWLLITCQPFYSIHFREVCCTAWSFTKWADQTAPTCWAPTCFSAKLVWPVYDNCATNHHVRFEISLAT